MLWDAVNDGNKDMAKLLIANGADVNIDDGIALERAVRNGDIEMVKLLLERGAKPRRFVSKDGNANGDAINKMLNEAIEKQVEK